MKYDQHCTASRSRPRNKQDDHSPGLWDFPTLSQSAGFINVSSESNQSYQGKFFWDSGACIQLRYLIKYEIYVFLKIAWKNFCRSWNFFSDGESGSSRDELFEFKQPLLSPIESFSESYLNRSDRTSSYSFASVSFG